MTVTLFAVNFILSPSLHIHEFMLLLPKMIKHAGKDKREVQMRGARGVVQNTKIDVFMYN